MHTRSNTAVLDRLARYTLFAPLAEGRRVLDIGSLDGRGLAVLAEAGAAEITAVAASPAALIAQLEAAGVEGVEVLAEESLLLPCEDASFDLVICHDLPERMAATPDFVTELRRVLDRDGYLALAVANPEGRWLGQLFGERPAADITYQELYERLAPSFGTMSAYGQAPLAASLFYDLASEDEDPGLVFDRSLLAADDEPGWFVLLFGPAPWRRDELSIVQLPFDELERDAGSRARPEAAALADTPPEVEVEVDADAAAASAARIAALEEELAVQRSQAEGQARGYEIELGGWREQLEAAEARANAIGMQLEAQGRARDEALARLQEVEAQLARARHDGASLESQIRDLLEEGMHLRRIIETLQARLPEEETSIAATPAADTESSAALAAQPPLASEASEGTGEPSAGITETTVISAASISVEADAKVPELDAAIAAELAGAPMALPPDLEIPSAAARPTPYDTVPGAESAADVEGSVLSSTSPLADAAAGPPASAPYDGFSLDEGVSVTEPAHTASTSEPSGVEDPTPASLDELLGGAPPTSSTATAASGMDALPDAGSETLPDGVAFEPKNVQESPIRAPGSAAATDPEAAFGELEVELPAAPERTTSNAKPRSPTTLDDLEDLLANSIPPARNR